MALPFDKRTRKAPESQQARVLELLWALHGGNYELSRQLKFTYSVLNSWKRIVGRVPLEHVGKVSRKLKISHYLLNYNQVKDFFGEGPTWEKVVKDSKLFNKEQLKYIFKGKPPEYYA